MKKLFLGFAAVLVLSVPAHAGFFDDLGKLQDLLGKGRYVCTAGAFGRKFQVEDKDEYKARFEVEKQCNEAGVSWVYCSANCQKKRL